MRPLKPGLRIWNLCSFGIRACRRQATAKSLRSGTLAGSCEVVPRFDPSSFSINASQSNHCEAVPFRATANRYLDLMPHLSLYKCMSIEPLQSGTLSGNGGRYLVLIPHLFLYTCRSIKSLRSGTLARSCEVVLRFDPPSLSI